MLLIIAVNLIVRTVLQKTAHQRIVLQKIVHLRTALLTVRTMHQIVDRCKSLRKCRGLFTYTCNKIEYAGNETFFVFLNIIKKNGLFMNKFELISLDKAKSLVLEPGYIAVDLRSRNEYDAGHIENAINIEDGTIDDIAKFNRRDLTWILYCRRGSWSFRLASDMSLNGYKVMAVVGGFRER